MTLSQEPKTHKVTDDDRAFCSSKHMLYQKIKLTEFWELVTCLVCLKKRNAKGSKNG